MEWDSNEVFRLEHMQDFDKLNIEGWNKLEGIEDKKTVLQRLENTNAEILKRSPVPLRLDVIEDGASGYYDNDKREIVLNIDKIKECNTIAELQEVRDTVLHEGYHAYQHYAMEHPEVHPNRNEVEIWRENDKDYISCRDDFIGYWTQPIEVSARAYAETNNKLIAEANGETFTAKLFDTAGDIAKSAMSFLSNNSHIWRPALMTAARVMQHRV